MAQSLFRSCCIVEKVFLIMNKENGYRVRMEVQVRTNMELIGIIPTAVTLHIWTTRSTCFTQ